ncbi:MAG: hypothetical protein EA362_12595 [Saprospirales bacterium]|nr:MAG: hypothetical protein EA362_12595 [Saprospirales bacterium]
MISGIQVYASPDPLSGPALVGLQVAAFVVIIRILSKVTVVSMSNIAGERRLEVRSLFKRKRIRGPFKCKRWWNYNFNNAQIINPVSWQSKPAINYLFMYCLIQGINGKVLIFEEVQLAARRVSDRDYRTEPLDFPVKKFKVWNLNRCLRRIGLGEDCGG